MKTNINEQHFHCFLLIDLSYSAVVSKQKRDVKCGIRDKIKYRSEARCDVGFKCHNDLMLEATMRGSINGKNGIQNLTTLKWLPHCVLFKLFVVLFMYTVEGKNKK